VNTTTRTWPVTAIVVLFIAAAGCYVTSFLVTTTLSRALLQASGTVLVMAVLFVMKAAGIGQRRKGGRP
jgi:hypothetical protein